MEVMMPFSCLSIQRFLDLLPTLLCLFLFFVSPCHATTINSINHRLTIGAIIDLSSHVGRQQKVAMDIAVRNFNGWSRNLRLFIHYNSSMNPIQAALAAQELIEQKKAQVIIGMGCWEEATLVADVGSRFQVPTMSLSSPGINPPFASHRWPYLVQMAENASARIQCLADIVKQCRWSRVIVIHEDEPFGGSSGSLPLLITALQQGGAEVEHNMVLPPLETLSNPKMTVQEELEKIRKEKYYSRVFIVLGSSLTLANHVFKEAKDMGLMGKNSVWIIEEGVIELLSASNQSFLQSIDGALGIMPTYSGSQEAFQDFEAKFRLISSEESPGFHAVLAYDGVDTIAKAMERLIKNSRITSKVLMESIMSTRFTGLSGEIFFEKNRLVRNSTYRVVNIVNQEVRELGFWVPGWRFPSDNVTWPGGLKDTIPKGWKMPTPEDPMMIRVPDSHSFNNFVTVPPGKNPPESNYSGLCIELFRKILKKLEESEYKLPYKFLPYNGSYEDMINQVYNKSYDAIVGDVTITANRSNYVEFTQPYAESGLSVVLPAKSDYNGLHKGWIFLMPFTREMWFVTLAIVAYTAFIVWFLEHGTNQDFRGPWKDQLGKSIWFIFNSLFLSHREEIKSGYTRVVLAVWLIVVLILTQSYTADLSSMLLGEQLNQNKTFIATLQRKNATVACDGESFVPDFLSEVLKFDPGRIKGAKGQMFDEIHTDFKNGTIQAAFLEVAYAKLFNNQHCSGYTVSTPDYRYGGLSFVFTKGSPIAADFSRVILELTEQGCIKDLEKKWLSENCSSTDADTNSKKNVLSLSNFWGIFLLSGAISTICLLLHLLTSLRKYRHYEEETRKGSNENRTTLSFSA